MQHKTIIGSAGLLTALALTGCGNNQPATPPTNTVVNTTPAAGTTTTATTTGAATTTTTAGGAATPDTKINTNAGPGGSTGTDTATADAINTAIVHNKQMTGARVEPVVTGGVARLNGTVQNQQQKALAATTASKTAGVSSVINKLQIIATGGAHAAPAKPRTVVKVYNHTTVVHDKQYVPVPSGGGNSSDNGTSDNGNSSDNGGTDSSNSPASPNAPTTPGGNP